MALQVWTDPGSQPGTGFFLSAPEVWVEDDALVGSASYSWSLGTTGSPTAYGTGTGTLTNEASQVGASIGSYPNVANLIVRVTYGGATITTSVSFTSEVPLWSTWGIYDSEGVATSTRNLPKSGSVRFTGLKASNAATSFTMPSIEVYIDGLLCIELVETTPALSSNYIDSTYKVYWHQRSRYYKQRDGSDKVLTGSAKCNAGALTIKFKSKDVPVAAESLYVRLVNSAGMSTKTASTAVNVERFLPKVDRLSVSYAEDGNVQIIGNLITDTDLQGVEFTTDRRVPVLHLFNGPAKLTSVDSEPPVDSLNTAFQAGPLAGTSAVQLSNGSNGAYITYSNEFFNPMEGTVEFWYKPDATLDSTVRTLTYIEKPGMDYLAVRVSSNGLSGVVRDSLSSVFSATASGGFSAGTWYHCTVKWKTNEAGQSRLSAQRRVRGGAATTGSVSGTFAWSVLPTTDLSSVLSNTSGQDTTNYYSALYLGSGAPTACPSGCLFDYRLSDVWGFVDHSLDTEPSGWKTSGALASLSVNTTTKMFKIAGSATLTSGAVEIFKIRGYTVAKNRAASSFFNTGDCRPMLVAGPWTGVPSYTAGGGQVGQYTDASGTVWTGFSASLGDMVERFRFLDAQGEFPDYTLEVNPTSFSLQEGEGEMVRQVSSINGSRVLSTTPLPATSTSMSWDRCSKVQMEALRDRAVAGNSFFLIDHNMKVYYGKIALESVEEIIATVPSRYRVSIKLLGQGGRYDYQLD